jgi:hypothetical protein
MTPAQRNQCRTALRARADTLQASGFDVQWLIDAARAWVADFGLTNLWWGACAMVVRAERIAGLRALTPDVRTQILALLEELRVASGGSTTDPDFKDPSQP